MIPGIVAGQMRTGSTVAESIRTSLLSWWDFSENGTGTAFADSHGSNHLTASAATSTLSTASGRAGRALEVNAVGEHAYLGDATKLAFANQSFTVFLWHYRNSTQNPASGAGTILMSKYWTDGDQRSYELIVAGGEPGDSYRFNLSSGGALASTTSIDGAAYIYSPLGWDFIAGGYDADRDMAFLIVNGARYEQSHAGGAFAASTAKLAFGSRKAGDNAVGATKYGRYDSAGAINKAITDAEYAVLYNGGAGLDYAGLLSA